MCVCVWDIYIEREETRNKDSVCFSFLTEDKILFEYRSELTCVFSSAKIDIKYKSSTFSCLINTIDKNVFNVCQKVISR